MFTLDQDKPFVVMPVCYHPTTILAVDDEISFLKALKTLLSKKIPLLCFNNPEETINFVENSRELQIPFAARLHFTGKEDTVACGFSKLSERVVQDFIHPFPKEIDMSFIENKDQLMQTSTQQLPKLYQSFDDFKCSQYIITETSLYYYNQFSRVCDWISSDRDVLKQLGNNFLHEVEDLTSEELEKITNITNHQRPTKINFLITDVRKELYNKNRLKEIILVSTDYDMPGKNGIEFIKTIAFPGVTLDHVLIILTGKNSEEFKQRLNALALPTEYIEKDDPDYFNKLIHLIDKKHLVFFKIALIKCFVFYQKIKMKMHVLFLTRNLEILLPIILKNTKSVKCIYMIVKEVMFYWMKMPI